MLSSLQRVLALVMTEVAGLVQHCRREKARQQEEHVVFSGVGEVRGQEGNVVFAGAGE